MNNAFLTYVQHFADRLLKRDTLITLFMRSADGDLPKWVDGPNDYTPGDIISMSNARSLSNFALVLPNGELLNLPKNKVDINVPFDLYDEIEIGPTDIINWNLPTKGTTTIGRYILNYILLASVFGDKIDYVNDVWPIGKIENKIAEGIMNDEITVKQYRQYMDNGYFIAHFGEICVPTVTEKSFTTDPNIQKRKKELLEQYKDQLKDPLIIEKIESDLIAMDKAWLKDDPAAGFHDVNAKKSYGIHRKKMFLTVGGIESFDTDGASYNFIQNSLNEGWDVNDMDVIANETRKGSYNRGKETAKGGAQTKFILRVFQDVGITEDDCGTTTTITHTITKANMKNYIGRSILEGTSFVLLDDSNISKYIDKTVKLRSPMGCKTKAGLCHVCSGRKFGQADIEAIGTRAIAISSKFMLASMKAFHGKTISVKKVNPLDYIV